MIIFGILYAVPWRISLMRPGFLLIVPRLLLLWRRSEICCASTASIRELPISTSTPEEVDRVLGEVDGVYVAGGETFDLMWLLRSTGNDEVLIKHVRAGLPYIGTSAGAVIAGPSIEPISFLDSPDVAPNLSDYSGLGLCEHVVVPHAGGTIPQFPIDVFAETVRTYGAEFPLVLLKDGQALLIDDHGVHLI